MTSEPITPEEAAELTRAMVYYAQTFGFPSELRYALVQSALVKMRAEAGITIEEVLSA